MQPLAPFQHERISRDHSAYLDAWRGGSALAVVVGHYFQIFTPSPWIIWGHLAAGAVMAFFVLSGFFIHKSLSKSVDRPTDFIAARADRILPPFLAAIALTIALWAIAPHVFPSGSRALAIPYGRPDFSLHGLAPTLLFVNGFFGGTLSADGPLWSLSYEVWYYVLAFGLFLVWSGRRLGWLLLPAALVLTVRNPAFLVLGLVWAMGFAVSIAHANARLPRIPAWPALILAAALYWNLMYFELAFGLFFALHVANVLRRPAPHVPFLPKTASFGYTLYVIHFPIMLFAAGCGFPALPSAFVAVGCAALVGPRLEALKPFARRRPRTPPTAAPEPAVPVTEP